MAPSTVNLTDLADRYVSMQLAGDRRAALRFIEELLADGVTAEQVSNHIVAGAQRDIGRLWQENRITIAQEHMATAISQLVLAHVFRHAHFRERVGKKILIACVAGEHHDFPARLLADTLDVAGYEVRFLGANVPLDPLLGMVEAERPDLLALSVTMLFNLPSLYETVRAVRRSGRWTPPIAAGGHALHDADSLPEDIHIDLVAQDGRTFLPRVDELLGVVS